jgi:prevent-host-death family protein
VGVRELRQNLSRYLERVKAGEGLIVTERGREVARLIPSGASADRYVELGQRLGATIPVARLEDTRAVSKTVVGLWVDRGFESHPLRLAEKH